MRRCEDALEREFYLRATARNGWARAVLNHQLDNKTYEKYLLRQSSFEFMGSQYRPEVGGQEYFIDLLLFHRRLRGLVAVELKIGDFKLEHKGKMEFYPEAIAARLENL